MHPLVAFAVLFTIPLVHNENKSGIIWTYYKKRCLTGATNIGSLREEHTTDLLTCSLHCQGDQNCCIFRYNHSSSTCVMQGDVLTHQALGTWYIEMTKGDAKNSPDRDSGRLEAQTHPTTQHRQWTTGITQAGVSTSFQHVQNITLHQACEEGRLDEVKYILSTGLEDINCQDIKGMTPVMSAAWKAQEAVFDFLVTCGCNVSLVNKFRNNVLHVACQGGNANIVSKLIGEHKFDIDCRGGAGWTPVMYAAYYGKRVMVDLLVHKGCSLTVVSDRAENLLHVACIGGYVDVVKYFITQKLISLESRGNSGATPVLTAAAYGQVAVASLLESNGCNMTETDNLKRNILHIACFMGHVDMVKHVLDKNIVGIDSKDNMGRTPVMGAVEKGHLDVVKILELKRCNLKAFDDNRHNLLHVACIGGHVDMVRHIVMKSMFSIDSRDASGRTPVSVAAALGHVGVVKFLRGKGCNMRVTDSYRNNILHTASLEGHIEMVKYILKAKVVGIESRGYTGLTAVMATAMKGHVEVAEVLRSKGCNLKVIDQKRNNILHLACYSGNVDMVKYILKLNTVGIDSRGCNGETAVMMAAKMGHAGVVDLLRHNGCNIRITDDNKNTILHSACFGGHGGMVKYILKLNTVGIEQRGFYGRPAVMIAVIMGHVGVVDLLKEKGCDMKIVDDARNNILHVACIGGHVNMVRYLMRLDIVSRRNVNKSGMTPIQVAKTMGHKKVVALFNAWR